MNIEIFKRNIKLQELGIGKLSIREQKILDFLNDNLTNLNTYSDKYVDYLLFGKDKDNIVLEYSKIDEHLFVGHGEIWSLFESTFNMKYDEIEELIEWWVILTLHLKVSGTTYYTNLSYPNEL